MAAAPIRAQQPVQPVTRAQAVAAALARGAPAAFGRADTAAAAGVLRAARLYPNPSLAASYTKDLPHYHVLADLALDLPWLRAARVGAAASARDAARNGFAFGRAAIRFDVDTTYTRALAALAHARLSRRTASDADSLLRMAQLRREVGDASELDVRLAEVNAGQLENIAADDALVAVDALLAVQLAMGLPAETPTITLADSPVAALARRARLHRGDGTSSAQPALARERGPRRRDVAPGLRRRRHPARQRARGPAQRPRGAGALHRRRRSGERRGGRRAAPERRGPAVKRGALLGVTAALLTACRAGAHGDEERAGTSAAAQTVLGARTAVATVQAFPQIVRAIGTVVARPGRFAELAAPAPTRVAAIFVAPGERVAEGDSLVAFERAPFDAAAQSAEAALESAQHGYARALRLVQAGILPQKDADQAAAELAQAQVAAVAARRSRQLATLRRPA